MLAISTIIINYCYLLTFNRSLHPEYHFERTVFTNTLSNMITLWTIRHSLTMLYRFFKIYYPHLIYFEDYSSYTEEEEEEEEEEDSSYENAGSEKSNSHH